MMSYFPATLVKFPDGHESHRAAFYLAAERWVGERLIAEGDGTTPSYLFTWQVAPTVVMGRNQIAEKEVDLTFCHEHNIDVIRRHSGGGAIYADKRNIMISLITKAGAVEPLFNEYSNAVAAMLTQFGAPATATGRNDILVDTGKVCGNAFYHGTKSNIVHGTMLYDTDYDMMMGALRPPLEKLKRHGVESVRQRTALLKDYLTFGVGELRQRVEDRLTSGSILLTIDDLTEIEQIEQNYYKEKLHSSNV